jgi:proteic killer suppression protein
LYAQRTTCYDLFVIQSFANRETEQLFETGRSRKFGSVAAIAMRKLQLLDNTGTLDDLRQPPGNRLEALKGDRKGQHSIRNNERYRICFLWKNDVPHDVEIVDYH